MASKSARLSQNETERQGCAAYFDLIGSELGSLITQAQRHQRALMIRGEPAMGSVNASFLFDSCVFNLRFVFAWTHSPRL